jgi:hypothetical protein
LNVQASASLDTFADEIVEPAASRVLAMSPFGYGHDPRAAGAAANVIVFPAEAGLVAPQPAITKLATTSRVAPTAVPLVTFAFM